MRRIVDNTEGERNPVQWHEIDQRLHKIEDALVTMQTVMNLLLDLLERAIPESIEEMERKQ